MTKKNWKLRLKRQLAGLLSICVIAASSLPANMTVWAAPSETELENEDLDRMGSCDSTSYYFKAPTSGGTGQSGNGHLIDFRGHRTPSRGYNTSDSTTMKTTYANYGYGTYINTSPTGGSASKRVTIATNGGVSTMYGGDLEVKMKVSSSADDKYVLFDYWLYNATAESKTYYLGSGTDVMIGNDDTATCILNERGIHMVNGRQGTADYFAAFDAILCDDEELGTTAVDTKWVGRYTEFLTNIYRNSSSNKVENIDSGIAFSWTIPMRPYETVHKRVAFSVRLSSYYVHPTAGSDSAEGSYSAPLKTIGAAMDKIGGKKGYIFIMDDYSISASEIDTIQSKWRNNMDITILSTDFTMDEEVSDEIMTIRAADAQARQKSLFTVTANRSLQFNDIKLSGENFAGSDNEPLLSNQGGTLGIGSGTEITGCLSDREDVLGSVIEVESGNLSMNDCKIQNNSANGEKRGAVYFNGTQFTVSNNIQITGNTPGNVVLGNGKVMEVTGDLGEGEIGVTAMQDPASSDGNITSSDQEVVVAKASGSYGETLMGVPFADNFKSDRDAEGITIGVGTYGANRDNSVVLWRSQRKLSVNYELVGGGTVGGAPEESEIGLGAGESVSYEIQPVSGYRLSSYVMEPDSDQIRVDLDGMRITGSMPDSDVRITLQWELIQGSISFETYGGVPQPDALTGNVGGPVGGLMPTGIQKDGYIFKGWSLTPEQDGELVDSGDFPTNFPLMPVVYYAQYEMDPSVAFDYTVKYTNASEDITFNTITTGNHPVESEISAQKREIPGYTFTDDDGYTVPATYQYIFASGTNVGAFEDGRFTGKMPGQNATVVFPYRVDQDVTQTFTVKYQTDRGDGQVPTEVASPVSGQYCAEAIITASPVTVDGYVLTGWEITKGNEAGTDDSNLVSQVQGSFDSAGNFQGSMPNQEVEITYLYEATDQGYSFQTRYLDDDSRDVMLQDIVAPITHVVAADREVSAEQKELYGYTAVSRGAVPNIGSFDSEGDYTAVMPNETLAVDYHYERNPAEWVSVHFKKGSSSFVALSGEGISPDVVEVTPGQEYRSDVLKEDGNGNGYTLSEMLEKNLVPKVTVTDDHYQFAGWSLEGQEEILDGETRFSGPATLVPVIEKNPAKWVKVQFAAGEHGSINPGETTEREYEIEKTWGDISGELPEATPEVNYLEEGWYDGTVPMEGSMSLRNGAVYTIQFYPDPSIWGTNVSRPEATGGIHPETGKGRITIYGADEGYQYVVTEADGTILDIQEGTITGRIYTEGLYPEGSYLVYETAGSTNLSKGGNITSANGTVSDPEEVVIPVVEGNYQITFDEEHDGKTVLTISPADPESRYALLDGAGELVYDWQEAGGSITFRELDYNTEYVVVAKPKDMSEGTPQDRYANGSRIVTDPGTVLEIENYVVETVDGTVVSVDGEEVGESRYLEAHKGDSVVIHAEDEDSAGMAFRYWEVLIGTVPGEGRKIYEKDVTFVMPSANVVLAARYESSHSSGSLAEVEQESRGGNGELSMDTTVIPGLEEAFTTVKDRELIDVNGASVKYKVVFQKNKVKEEEADLVRAESPYSEHEEAFKDAWGLDVELERYVNGRKVVATPSELATVSEIPVYIQLDKEDVDMLDYGLYEIREDEDGEEYAVAVELASDSTDPEANGGLFKFEAYIGRRYVFVYSKAYRVYFINDVIENQYQKYFKVRREESIGDGEYSLSWQEIQDDYENWDSHDADGRLGMSPYRSRSTGVEYWDGYWSYSKKRRSGAEVPVFDTDKEITRETYVYMNYLHNDQGKVDETRKDLEDMLGDLIEIADDPFLKKHETEEIKEVIREGLDILDGEKNADGTITMPPLSVLEEWKERIESVLEETKEVLDGRYDGYGDVQDDTVHGGSGSGGGSGNGSGGSGSSGGGSAGSGSGPFNPTPVKDYVIGTNGTWDLLDPKKYEWAFILNGGERLKNMWASLSYQYEGTNRKGWYRFSEAGLVMSGWYQDEKGNWYYLNPSHDGWYGEMQTGWHYEGGEGNWYYLDPVTGAMATGWREIGGKWYYFNETAQKPYGAMYAGTETPDGYRVGQDGSWLQ